MLHQGEYSYITNTQKHRVASVTRTLQGLQRSCLATLQDSKLVHFGTQPAFGQIKHDIGFIFFTHDLISHAEITHFKNELYCCFDKFGCIFIKIKPSCIDLNSN